jgi:class 3 adenylate cyclase
MRKWLVIPVVVLVLAVGLPRPAGATAPTEYIVTFAIVSGFQPVTCQSQNKAHSCSSYRAVLAGDIAGSATATEDDVPHADGTLTIHGMVTCACTVAGHSGNLTVKYVGTGYMVHATIRSARVTRVAVAGYDVVVRGTGGLATVHGQGIFLGINDSVTKDLFLHFGPS